MTPAEEGYNLVEWDWVQVGGGTRLHHAAAMDDCAGFIDNGGSPMTTT